MSAELKQQWLSTSKSHGAHDLLASLGTTNDDADGAADADRVVIHGPGGTGSAFDVDGGASVGSTGDVITSRVTSSPPPNFKRRTGSLRDKLRGTVSEARDEARYFS